MVALRDKDGDGKLETKETFGTGSITGIALRNGYLYVAKFNSVERFKMTPGQLKAGGEAEVVVSGLPGVAQHGDKGIAFDGKGSLYVNVGAPSNACQDPGSTSGRQGSGSLPAAREERRHLEVRREQARTEAGGRHQASQPGCVRCPASRGTTMRSTSR